MENAAVILQRTGRELVLICSQCFLSDMMNRVEEDSINDRTIYLRV
jgi:hypothetical protein